MFKGKYHGKRAHVADLDAVLQRAAAHHVGHIMITAGNLKEARAALHAARRHNASCASASGAAHALRLYSTVGVHPTNATQLDADPHHDDDSDRDATAHASRLSNAEYIAAMHAVIADGVVDGTVVAIGECGLDYDRLFFAPKESQLAHFELHFDLAETYGLPMFLHDRNTGGDFLRILQRHRHRFTTGVVHSFTGTLAEMQAYVDAGLYIGINGCSLKTADNCAVAAAVPLERLMLETDAPWCEIKRTHASHAHVKTVLPSVKKEKYAADKLVQGRCEPCCMIQVAEAVAGIKGMPVADVVAAATANSVRVFLEKGR